MITFSRHFDVLQPISEGRYGKVYKVIEKDSKRILAAKQLPYKRYDIRFERNKSMIEREVRNWRAIQDCSNILPYYGVARDGNNIYLLSEYCPRGSMATISNNWMIESRVCAIIRHVMQGIQSCHVHDIVHCDIKPTNIVYAESIDQWCLCDFGSSQKCQGQDCGIVSKSHTPLYASPEILEKRECGKCVDVWSVGIMVYMMLLHRHPYCKISNDLNLSELKANVLENGINWDHSEYISGKAKDFIDNCLVKDHHKRFTITEALHHQFMES
jgi:serine/threonine protein kinase